MKMGSFRRQRGSVLIAALVIGLVVGLSLVSYLSWASTQNRLIMRSQSWNGALTLVEAGLEEALAHLKESPTNRARYGWALSSNGVSRTRSLGEGYYVVSIDKQDPPVVVAEGFFTAPLAKNTYLSRKVMVTTTNRSKFPNAFTADQKIDLNGNKLRVDSFDSTDPGASSGGRYDPTKAKDNGNLAINLGIIDALNIGNAEIHGKISTGPGGLAKVGSNGSVGSTAWHAAGNKGVEPGWSADDFNQPIETFEGPTSGATPVGGVMGANTYDYILSSGIWQVSELDGSVLVTGNATLIVDESVDITGSESIVILPTASLNMYVYGSSAKFGNAGVVNLTADASKFMFFGGPATTDVRFIGSVQFTGVIHAPAAEVKIGGGGTEAVNFVGAATGKSLTLVGHVNAHYDEALMKKFPNGYVVTSWKEL